MGNVNGANENTRVGVCIKDLENIGDQLRVHFGKTQEGTPGMHIGSEPHVFKVGMTQMGPGSKEYIYTYRSDFNGVHGPDGETVMDMYPLLYKDHFDLDYYVGDMAFPIVNTMQIPGAAYIKIKMSYSMVYQGLEELNYMWLGKGLHGEASELQGEYLPKFSAWAGDWKYLEGHTSYCMSCGTTDYYDPVHNCGVSTGEGTDGGLHSQTFPIKFQGPILPVIERTIDGDSFTFIWILNFTGNPYTSPDESNLVGYYMEVTPYNANNQPMTDYSYIVGEIPRSYAVGAMSYEVAKLNNYPNAEEVKF